MLAYHANSTRSSQRRRRDFRLLFEGNIQVEAPHTLFEIFIFCPQIQL